MRKSNLADLIVGILGSWTFLCLQTLAIAGWMIGNAKGWYHFDPPPWLRLNIAMSIMATYATPLVLIADRRQSKRNQTQIEQHQALLEFVRDILMSERDQTHAIQMMLESHREMLERALQNDAEIVSELEAIQFESMDNDGCSE